MITQNKRDVKPQYLNQARQLAQLAPGLLAQVEAGQLTCPQAIIKLAEKNEGWQTTAVAPDSQVLRAVLANLKAQLNSDQPPAPAPRRPFPQIVLSAETREFLAEQEAGQEAKKKALDKSYQAALRPDSINLKAGFYRNQNIERR